MPRNGWPTTAWREGAPESVAVDPDRLDALDREVDARYRSINGIVVIARSGLVYERYGAGVGPDDAHDVASVTKSVTSALIGIAIARGQIESVGQRVLDYFPEVATQPQETLKRAMTIEHLLTMTAGFPWRTGARAYEPLLERMWRTPDWVAFILSLPVLERAYGTFQYNSACSHLLSAILTRATGRSARAFANEHLFAPLGMAEAAAGGEGTRPRWPEDPQGYSTGGWGLALRPRDMARFGYLYLSRGEWDGVQILPQAWVDASLAPHTPGYGYQWWLRDLGGLTIYSAVGRGGHHVYIVPDRDLVVAIASRPAGRWRDRWLLLEEHILPCVSP